MEACYDRGGTFPLKRFLVGLLNPKSSEIMCTGLRYFSLHALFGQWDCSSDCSFPPKSGLV